MKACVATKKLFFLTVPLACALLVLTSRVSTAQNEAGIGQTVPGVGVPQAVPTALATPTAPFTKFNVFVSGPFTQSAPGCPDVSCSSGSCTGCTTFSNLPIKGLAGAKLSGELLYESGYATGGCAQEHGIATATATTFTINFVINGHACVFESFDDIQFTGNYVVVGGSGSYCHAAGTGSFTTDIPNFFETVTRSLSMNGTIQKAK